MEESKTAGQREKIKGFSRTSFAESLVPNTKVSVIKVQLEFLNSVSLHSEED